MFPRARNPGSEPTALIYVDILMSTEELTDGERAMYRTKTERELYLQLRQAHKALDAVAGAFDHLTAEKQALRRYAAFFHNLYAARGAKGDLDRSLHFRSVLEKIDQFGTMSIPHLNAYCAPLDKTTDGNDGRKVV